MAGLIGRKIALRNISTSVCLRHGVNNGDIFEVFDEVDGLRVRITLRSGKVALVHPDCYELLDDKEIDFEGLLAFL